MRVRELKYPIAILGKTLFIGGSEAGTKSARGWNYGLTHGYLNGHNDNDVFFDSLGRQFHVEAIELHDLRLIDRLLSTIESGRKGIERQARFDIVLKHVSTLQLDDFRAFIMDFLRQNPDWIHPHPDDDPSENFGIDEVAAELGRCKSFKDLITAIGFHHPNHHSACLSPGHSTKVIDRRRTSMVIEPPAKEGSS